MAKRARTHALGVEEAGVASLELVNVGAVAREVGGADLGNRRKGEKDETP